MYYITFTVSSQVSSNGFVDFLSFFLAGLVSSPDLSIGEGQYST